MNQACRAENENSNWNGNIREGAEDKAKIATNSYMQEHYKIYRHAWSTLHTHKRFMLDNEPEIYVWVRKIYDVHSCHLYQEKSMHF